MALLADPTDLQSQMPLVSAAALDIALRRASDAFIDAAGWPILEHDAEVVLHGDGGRTLFLPARHVTTATVVIRGREPVTVGAPESPVRLDGRLGVLTHDDGWPRGFSNITVSYTAGWVPEEVPGGIKDAVLERASWLAMSPGGMATQITAGPFSASLGAGRNAGATQVWSDAVSRYAIGVGDRA